ncbi:MAG: type VI secretion system protein TssA [Treponema sp.]|jgi:type VI secretion system protein ImpA|nr:type VI secretion system protein TssA [Treponema sp.]
MLDYAALALPLEGGDPAGENLEYDALYLAMDSLATAVPDSLMGDAKIEGREADWKKLREHCLNLWGRTRDLRVAAYLVVAETAAGGFKDCGEALRVIRFLIRDMWDAMYPRLDPEDDNDPTERLNILAMLSPEPGAFNDPIMFIAKFRAAKLAPGLPYTLRDYLIAVHELETADEQTLDTNLIMGELMSLPPGVLEEQAAAVAELQETLKNICEEANEKMPGGYILGMAALSRDADRLGKLYASCLAASGGAKAETNQNAETPGAMAANAPVLAAAAQQGVNLAAYKALTREDALLLLRKGAEYFQRQEPNSPIPLLVDRALRFSEMNFIELLADIAPDALSRGKEILGLKEE